ncbi:hypothetical protein DEM27_28635 [Metarhizobium album]|uniref:Uncharacterized protein n=1 Tax=Metarhizobium album TaxID=2182425 RepID=A0A2U2DHH8_9HYPH|nr:hypothetical protein [Rhizobium album]PWE52773.1 hypothetical protein DEM27_28635 [Rhizobium album]
MTTVLEQLETAVEIQVNSGRYAKPEDWPVELGPYIPPDQAKANLMKAGQRAIDVGRQAAEEAVLQPALLRNRNGREAVYRAIGNAVDTELQIGSYAEDELLPALLDVRDTFAHISEHAFEERLEQLFIAGAGQMGRC